MALTMLPSSGAMSKGSVIFTRPLVNSIVAGLSIGFSSREQIPRTLARFHFANMAPNSSEKDFIGSQSRCISGVAWVNSYGTMPSSVKR